MNIRKRERERERKRRRETMLAREQGCTRALFACVCDVNIIRQTHLNRLKILTSTSRPPLLCELSACDVCDFIEVRLAMSLCRQRGNTRPNYATVRGHLVCLCIQFSLVERKSSMRCYNINDVKNRLNSQHIISLFLMLSQFTIICKIIYLI